TLLHRLLYPFSHSPRESGRGGGTGLLLSQRWCSSPLPLSHLTISSFEFHAASVTSPINLFIIVIYRPPGPLGNFLDVMDTLLSVFPSDSTPLTVLGNFNLPSDKLHSSGLLALLNSFSLSFNSCPPTHKEGNVLDLVFTHPSPATDMTVTPLHISDHHLVSFTITLPVLPKRNSQHLSLTRRNLHSISPSSVASCTLSSLPDHESFSSLPLDSATDTLLSSLSSTMDLLCPLSTIRKKNSSTAPWLSDVLRNNQRELRSAARKWKKSKLDTDLISYRTLLSKFSLDVTSAKTSFYKEMLETSAQDPRKLHNIFSSLLNPPAPTSPFSLTAEDFATFYTEKIERICQTFTSLPTSPTSHSQHSATPSLTQLSTVASEEVLQITQSCNPTTCPLDPIPSAMFQTISPDLLPFITTVINGSLTSGHVPTGFKKVMGHPHPEETCSGSFRHQQLQTAFDTVNHKTLLSTLRSLEICGTAWEWFASYLDGRSYQMSRSDFCEIMRDAKKQYRLRLKCHFIKGLLNQKKSAFRDGDQQVHIREQYKWKLEQMLKAVWNGMKIITGCSSKQGETIEGDVGIAEQLLQQIPSHVGELVSLQRFYSVVLPHMGITVCYPCHATSRIRPQEGALARVLTHFLVFCPDIKVERTLDTTRTLIDSGVAVNLIDQALVEELHISTFPCTPPLRITAINSQPIVGGYLTHQTALLELRVGLFHWEMLAFHVISSPANPVILGFLWLLQHDPRISWAKGELLQWSPRCTEQCLTAAVESAVESTGENAIACIPQQYVEFHEVFSKERASRLPAHCPWDCAIDLLPNTTPPRTVFILPPCLNLPPWSVT
ncbi:hypothetical protein QTP70_032599, partial [Hemibagrus guttatus]